MAMGDAIMKRMEELSKRQRTIRPRMAEVAEGATLRAIEEAADHTPPNTYEDGEIRGEHMIAGELAQHWGSDSQATPVQSGDNFTTVLANDQEYASYVNDGHRVDKHFVPGLYVDKKGLLVYEPSGKDEEGKETGLMVGTKTSYVPGLYMKEKGVDKYKEVSEMELDKFTEEIFQE